MKLSYFNCDKFVLGCQWAEIVENCERFLAPPKTNFYHSPYVYLRNTMHPENVWFTLAAHMVLGIILISASTRTAGESKEMEE